jgi:hypothetical protein
MNSRLIEKKVNIRVESLLLRMCLHMRARVVFKPTLRPEWAVGKNIG